MKDYALAFALALPAIALVATIIIRVFVLGYVF